MGGKAIEGCKRINVEQFQDLGNRITSLPDLNGRVDVIKSYKAKQEFGDMDLLIECVEDRDRILNHLNPFQLSKNGPVWSLGVMFDPDTPFQVDLILSNPEDYEFSYFYFAYNDLGNLLGRVAHKMGFKFGHDGLHYVLRDVEDPNRVIKQINATKNFFHALEFLGYSTAVSRSLYHHGFEDLDEIFQFVSSGNFYHRELYPLEHRSHRARVRDAKRPTYQKFLNWIEENQPEDHFGWGINGFMDDLYRKSFIFRAFQFFDGFEFELNESYKEVEHQKEISKKITGQDVIRIAKVDEGIEVGRLLSTFKSLYSHDIEACDREEVLILFEQFCK